MVASRPRAPLGSTGVTPRCRAPARATVAVPTRPSVTPCTGHPTAQSAVGTPRRRQGVACPSPAFARSTERRPALTAAAPGVTAPRQVGTKKRRCGRTKKLNRKRRQWKDRTKQALKKRLTKKAPYKGGQRRALHAVPTRDYGNGGHATLCPPLYGAFFVKRFLAFLVTTFPLSSLSGQFLCSTAGPFLRPDLPWCRDTGRSRRQGWPSLRRTRKRRARQATP